MPSSDKALSLMGLAMRARRVITGAEGVQGAVRAGKAKAVLLCAGAGPNTLDKFTRMAETHGTQLLLIEPSDALGIALGKPNSRVAAITDEGFARRIKEELSEQTQRVDRLGDDTNRGRKATHDQS